MGYRSDVRLIVSKRGYKKLNNYINDYLKGNGNISDNCLNYAEKIISNHDYLYLKIDDIKWYDDYDSVKSFNYGLSKLEENEFSYRFARMGENYDDFDASYNDGENEKDSYIPFPQINRKFDDEYVKEELKENNYEIS